MNLTLEAAQALREGGIDATAGLNEALRVALSHMPEADHAALKKAFGVAMYAVFEATLEPALKAYPQLKPDPQTWAAIAKRSAARRAASDGQ